MHALQILRLLTSSRRLLSVRTSFAMLVAALMTSAAAVSGVTPSGGLPTSMTPTLAVSFTERLREGYRSIARSMWLAGRFPEPAGAGAHWQVAPYKSDRADFVLVTDEVRRKFFNNLPYGDLIRVTAERYQVDPALVAAVIESESGFRSEVVSSKGALGLMQLMPETGAWMGADDLRDPAENIEAGVRYLRYLQERFEGDLTIQLAAYNAGEGVVLRYGGVPPYRETQDYIRRVLSRYERTNREIARLGSVGAGTGRLMGISLSP